MEAQRVQDRGRHPKLWEGEEKDNRVCVCVCVVGVVWVLCVLLVLCVVS